MDKLLIEVICPATSKTYDFWVSKKLDVKTGRKKIMQEIVAFEASNIIFSNKDTVFAFSEDIDGVIDDNVTFEQAGLKSGDKIMLI